MKTPKRSGITSNMNLEQSWGIKAPQIIKVSESDLREEVSFALLENSLSVDEVAKDLGIAPKTLRNRLAGNSENVPPHVFLPGSRTRRFPRLWLNRWLKTSSLVIRC